MLAVKEAISADSPFPKQESERVSYLSVYQDQQVHAEPTSVHEYANTRAGIFTHIRVPSYALNHSGEDRLLPSGVEQRCMSQRHRGRLLQQGKQQGVRVIPGGKGLLGETASFKKNIY